MNHAQSGAVVGSGLGAMTGAIIGAGSGHAEGGALIGAAAGALAGGLAGDAEDAREERDAAIAQAAYTQQLQRAITNVDVIQMTQSGISDDVIVSSMNSQGGNFDLSPQGIISLKNSGVSDGVILAMQKFDHVASPPVTRVIHEPRTRVIIAEPTPSLHFSFGSGPRCRPRHHHHWHW
ncbi:MAG: hypothetical protein KDA93_23620 [Planctomycetaceae bacterium]|nr:hypothetical protein [Planctomycetaceae bacterium]